MLDQLIYTSQGQQINAQQIQDILESAHKNNPTLGVSGVLVLINTSFLQILEGPREAVINLFEIIKRDKRHTNVQLLSQQPIEKRAFPNWSMAYVEKTPDDIIKIVKEDKMGQPLEDTLQNISHTHEWIGDFIQECQKSITP